MNTQLTLAEQTLREQAITERRGGILITKENSTSFTLEITDKVPFGLTQEHQTWTP